MASMEVRSRQDLPIHNENKVFHRSFRHGCVTINLDIKSMYIYLPTFPCPVISAAIDRAKMPFPDYIPKRPSDETREQFDKDLKDLHLVYDYDAQNVDTGEPEKWRYEMWFFSSERIVYKIHGGPMAGRTNFQSASYQW
jgi:hypothetical protein